MTTLATLRGFLNDELGVTGDTTDTLFPEALRNRAIAQGYAALWRAGVRKPAVVDLDSVSDQRSYVLTGVRQVAFTEVLDSSSNIVDRLDGTLLADGSGGYTIQLPAVSAGFTIRVHGWTAYVSTFASDTATDDLDDEYNRIPLLKAKAICYRAIISQFARWQERQALPPELNLTLDQLLGAVAAAEREWQDETHSVARERPRFSQSRMLVTV